MASFIYLLAAIGATGNAPEPANVAPPPPTDRSSPRPRGNPGNWVNMNDYPSVALQKAIEGITSFTLTIDATGRVAECVITETSGSSVLDTATCINVTRRARFEPALDAAGNATTGKYANRVRWQIPSFVPEISFPRGPMMQGNGWARILPTDFPAKALSEERRGKVKIELAISSVGAVKNCKILESSSHADLDAKACEIAADKARFGPALDVAGQPTDGRVQTEINWRVPSESGTTPLPEIATKTITVPKELRPQAGNSTLSYVVSADGSLAECKGQTTMETKVFAPEALCDPMIKMEPYADTNGQKVARRVVIKTSVEIEEVK